MKMFLTKAADKIFAASITLAVFGVWGCFAGAVTGAAWPVAVVVAPALLFVSLAAAKV